MSVKKSQTATFELDDKSEQTSGYHAKNTRTVVVHENGGADRAYRFEKQMSRGQLFKYVAGFSVLCGLLLPLIGWLTAHGVMGVTVKSNEERITILDSEMKNEHKAFHDITTETKAQLDVLQSKQDRLITDVENNSAAAQKVLLTVERIETKMDAVHQ